jgi:hypothetical protein
MDDDSITPHYQSTLKLYQKACKLRDDAQRMAGYLDGEPAPEHHAALHNFQHARAMALVIISQCRAGKLVEALELHAHAVEVIERAYSQLKDEPAKRGQKFAQGRPRGSINALTAQIQIVLDKNPEAGLNDVLAWLAETPGFDVDAEAERVYWDHSNTSVLFKTVEKKIIEQRNKLK